MLGDFAENYSFVIQDAVQDSTIRQLSIHLLHTSTMLLEMKFASRILELSLTHSHDSAWWFTILYISCASIRTTMGALFRLVR